VVIFGSDRAKFGTPETSLKDKHICVTGKIQEYRGVPEIIVNDPKQLGQ
jgi:DNA/RNA endonuclease YhcR with UshA esterase domain